MNKIVKILMKRDGLDEDDALDIVDNLKEEAEEMLERGDLLGIEELLRSDLGLEPDYIFDLIDL